MFSNMVEALHAPFFSDGVDNLNVFDGGVYNATDPLLGVDAELGNVGTRIADKMIDDNHYDRVVLVPIAIGGTLIAEWSPPSGNLFQLFGAAFARCADQGLSVTAVLWAQGESDGLQGTSEAAYTSALTALIAGVRAQGHAQPWFLSKSTYAGGNVFPAIQAGIAACVNGTDIFAGPDTDALTGAANRYDTTHFTAVGANAAAALWSGIVAANL